MFDEAVKAFGSVDVVVNNSGIKPLSPIGKGDVALFDRVIQTNLRGTFMVMAQAAQRLAGGGRFIAFSSSVLARSFPTYGPYIASKACVEGSVHVLANEMRGRNITVNAVAPGPVGTELFLSGKSDEQITELAKLETLERLSEPEDIARVVSFLAVRRAAGSIRRCCGSTAGLRTEDKQERKMLMKQVIVVTGASSGFGALAARALADAGHTVYASMRETTGRNAAQVKTVEEYVTAHKVDLRAIELDVASQESADSAIRKIVEENGRLDVIVHNAGHMVFGPAEAFTPEQFAELYDVNVLSTQRVNRVALPQLRKQGRGLLVWVSSSSVAVGTPPYLHTLQQRRAWTPWRCSTRASWHSGALRPRLSCRAHSRRAPTTSRMPACPRTSSASPNTKRTI